MTIARATFHAQISKGSDEVIENLVDSLTDEEIDAYALSHQPIESLLAKYGKKTHLLRLWKKYQELKISLEDQKKYHQKGFLQAIAANQKDVIKLYLETKNAQFDDNLLKAIYENDEKYFQLLDEKLKNENFKKIFIDKLCKKDELGNLPLHTAIILGRDHAAQWLYTNTPEEHRDLAKFPILAFRGRSMRTVKFFIADYYKALREHKILQLSDVNNNGKAGHEYFKSLLVNAREYNSYPARAAAVFIDGISDLEVKLFFVKHLCAAALKLEMPDVYYELIKRIKFSNHSQQFNWMVNFLYHANREEPGVLDKTQVVLKGYQQIFALKPGLRWDMIMSLLKFERTNHANDIDFLIQLLLTGVSSEQQVVAIQHLEEFEAPNDEFKNLKERAIAIIKNYKPGEYIVEEKASQQIVHLSARNAPVEDFEDLFEKIDLDELDDQFDYFYMANVAFLLGRYETALKLFDEAFDLEEAGQDDFANNAYLRFMTRYVIGLFCTVDAEIDPAYTAFCFNNLHTLCKQQMGIFSVAINAVYHIKDIFSIPKENSIGKLNELVKVENITPFAVSKDDKALAQFDILLDLFLDIYNIYMDVLKFMKDENHINYRREMNFHRQMTATIVPHFVSAINLLDLSLHNVPLIHELSNDLATVAKIQPVVQKEDKPEKPEVNEKQGSAVSASSPSIQPPPKSRKAILQEKLREQRLHQKQNAQEKHASEMLIKEQERKAEEQKKRDLEIFKQKEEKERRELALKREQARLDKKQKEKEKAKSKKNELIARRNLPQESEEVESPMPQEMIETHVTSLVLENSTFNHQTEMSTSSTNTTNSDESPVESEGSDEERTELPPPVANGIFRSVDSSLTNTDSEDVSKEGVESEEEHPLHVVEQEASQQSVTVSAVAEVVVEQPTKRVFEVALSLGFPVEIAQLAERFSGNLYLSGRSWRDFYEVAPRNHCWEFSYIGNVDALHALIPEAKIKHKIIGHLNVVTFKLGTEKVKINLIKRNVMLGCDLSLLGAYYLNYFNCHNGLLQITKDGSIEHVNSIFGRDSIDKHIAEFSSFQDPNVQNTFLEHPEALLELVELQARGFVPSERVHNHLQALMKRRDEFVEACKKSVAIVRYHVEQLLNTDDLASIFKEFKRHGLIETLLEAGVLTDKELYKLVTIYITAYPDSTKQSIVSALHERGISYATLKAERKIDEYIGSGLLTNADLHGLLTWHFLGGAYQVNVSNRGFYATSNQVTSGPKPRTDGAHYQPNGSREEGELRTNQAHTF